MHGASINRPRAHRVRTTSLKLRPQGLIWGALWSLENLPLVAWGALQNSKNSSQAVGDHGVRPGTPKIHPWGQWGALEFPNFTPGAPGGPGAHGEGLSEVVKSFEG